MNNNSIITKWVVKQIAILIWIIMIAIPLLNGIILSWLWVYNINIDTTWQSKYSSFPIYWWVYMNQVTLEKLYNWYSKKNDKTDIKQFIEFLKETKLSVNRKTLYAFLISNGVCTNQNECNTYISILDNNNEDNIITENAKIQYNKMFKTVSLPNAYIWTPAEWRNSYFNTALRQPINTTKWVDFFLFKLSIDNYFKANSNIYKNDINTAPILLPDLDKHCYWNLSFTLTQDCWANTQNCITKQAVFTFDNAYNDFENVNHILDLKWTKDITHYKINENCNWVKKDIDYKQFIKDYFGYVTWATLSSPYLYKENKQDFSNIVRELLLIAQQDITVKINPLYMDDVSSSIEDALYKYFNTNYLKNNNWHIDQLVDKYFQDKTEPSDTINTWTWNYIKQKAWNYISDYISKYELVANKNINTMSGNNSEIEKTVKKYIKNDIAVLNKNIDNISKSKINILDNNKINFKKLFTILTVISQNIDNNWSISKWLTYLVWMWFPSYNQWILVIPIYYWGDYIISKDTIRNIIYNQVSKTYINLKSSYPIYFLFKTKAYDKWSELSEIKQKVLWLFYTWILFTLTFISYVLYILLIFVLLTIIWMLLYALVLRSNLWEKYTKAEIENLKQNFYNDKVTKKISHWINKAKNEVKDEVKNISSKIINTFK